MRSLPAALIRAMRRLLTDAMVCLRFFTRLPLPVLPFEPSAWHPNALRQALWVAPLAGLVIGGLGGLALGLGHAILGLPHLIVATLAIAAQIVASGGLHEDGLADVADGFGGGRDRDRKLDIMRDSRLGTFGTLALTLSIFMRIAASAALLDRYGPAAAAAALAATGAASRGFALLPLGLLPPARRDGLAHGAGMLPSADLATAVGLAVFLGIGLTAAGGLRETRALAACAAGLVAAAWVTHLAHRHIGGQTGDVAGAAQQASEIAFLIALLVAPGWG